MHLRLPNWQLLDHGFVLPTVSWANGAQRAQFVENPGFVKAMRFNGLDARHLCERDELG
jgi:hypothetical protein